MGGDEPMERWRGKMTLAVFLADRADKLDREYARVGYDSEYSHWYVRLLEKQIITGSY